MPALRARSSAGALALSDSNARMWIGASPRCCAASSAAKLLPRPEASTTMLNMCVRRSDDAHALGVCRRNDFTDRPRGQPKACQRGNAGVCRITRDDHGVANAAIEGAPHFTLRNIAFALQPVEHGGQLPCRAVERDAEPIWHDANDIFLQAAAGDVRHAVDLLLREQLQDRLDINRGRRKQSIGELQASKIQIVWIAGTGEDLADQRIAVGMRPRSSKADDSVAGVDFPAIDQAGFFHRADTETGQIVFAWRIHVGHLGRFATDECAAGQFTTAGDAADHAHRGGDVELAGGEVVEEEQGLGALYQHIVHAHTDQIDADGIVAAEHLRQLQFGTDAVGAGDEHRVDVAAGQLEQCAEAAQASHHFLAESTRYQRLDALDDFLTGIDVDAGGAIGEGLLLLGHAAAITKVKAASYQGAKRVHPETPGALPTPQ